MRSVSLATIFLFAGSTVGGAGFLQRRCGCDLRMGARQCRPRTECGCFGMNGGGISGSWNFHDRWSLLRTSAHRTQTALPQREAHADVGLVFGRSALQTSRNRGSKENISRSLLRNCCSAQRTPPADGWSRRWILPLCEPGWRGYRCPAESSFRSASRSARLLFDDFPELHKRSPEQFVGPPVSCFIGRGRKCCPGPQAVPPSLKQLRRSKHHSVLG